MSKQLNVNYIFIDEDTKLQYCTSTTNITIPVKFDSVPEIVSFQNKDEKHVLFLRNRMYFQARQRAFYLHYGFLNDNLCILVIEELLGHSYETMAITFIERTDTNIKITIYGKEGSEDLLLFYVTDTILFDEVGIIIKPESASYIELFITFPCEDKKKA